MIGRALSMDRAVVLSLEFAVMCEARQNVEHLTQCFFLCVVKDWGGSYGDLIFVQFIYLDQPGISVDHFRSHLRNLSSAKSSSFPKMHMHY